MPNMTYAAQALQFMIKLLSHPVSQRVLKHALRVATLEAVKHVQRKTRMTKKGYSTIS